MAEVIGLVASVASLIAFTSETSKACHKLAEGIASFKNAQTDIQKISVDLLDLAQILELIESVLQPLQEDKAGVQGHLELVERSLARIKTGVQEIADVLITAQPTTRGSSTKARAKWIYKKSDIASMIAIIDRQKQGLLLQFNLLNTQFAHTTHADLKAFRADLGQIVPRTEDLAACITTSTSESTSRFENVVQAAATSLQSSIKDEIRQTVLSIPRESNISQASLQTLSVLVSNIVASRFESLQSETLKYPGSRSCTQIESAQRPPNKQKTEDVGTMTRVSQAMIEDSRNEDSGNLNRVEGSSRLISRTSVQTMTSVFGRVVIRHSTVKMVYSDSNPEVFSERDKMEIDFIPASWLRSWTGCGIFLARIGFGKPAFDMTFTVARVLDFGSNLDTRKALLAVKSGDIQTLIGSLHRKVVYPTDRDEYGHSLLSTAAKSGQLEICELLLQQGAGVDINTPSFILGKYPIEYAIRSSIKRDNHDLVRLFLKYDADITIDISSGFNFALLPIRHPCAGTHETQSLFRLLVDNDPAFDINQRGGVLCMTPIMQASNQPLQVYEDLIKLGAHAQALAMGSLTVLHCFFMNMFRELRHPVSVDVFLDGGMILALLIQVGADPQATNRFGIRPHNVSNVFSNFPLRRVEKRIRLAFWHQALQICGLSGSKYCDCPVHQGKNIPRHDVDSHSSSRRRGLDRLQPYDAFEEEMSAALRGWDKSVAQRSDLGSTKIEKLMGLETWNERWDIYDKWIQKVLVELQARQKKASCERSLCAGPSVGDPSIRTRKEHLESDDRQSSEDIDRQTPALLTHETDSDEDWETNSSSSSNSEENWESAPET